ncbi:hypothetical protein GS498_09820 [Rhodococcus hoagii]|nr:hypothetical protein [Prescottella equi]
MSLVDSVRARGVDGSVWPLGGPRNLAKDAWIVGGLDALFVPPPFTAARTSRAYQIGSTPRMTKVEERLLDFRVRLQGRTRSDFEQLLAAWNRAWSKDADLDLDTRTETGGTRTISLRLDRQMKPASRISMQARKLDLEMVAVACWPYLRSGVDVENFKCPAGTHEGTILVSNPTDVPLWVEWGGTPGRWFLPDALSGRVVPIPVQNDVWKVRTRQNFETLSSASGEFVWPKMRGVNFQFEIPPGTPPTELPVRVENAPTKAELRVFMPRYHQMPWG